MKKSIVSSTAALLILLSSASFVPTASAHPTPNVGLYFDGIYLEFGDSRRYWNGYYDYWYPYKYDDLGYYYPPKFNHPPYRYDRHYPDYRHPHHHKSYHWRARPKRWKH